MKIAQLILSVIIAFTLGTLIAASQSSFRVKSFSETTEQDARVLYPINDQNGQKCALVKIVTKENNLSFDNGILGIVKTIHKPQLAEWWVYVPEETIKLKIAHPGHGQLQGDGVENGYYFFPTTLKTATTYRMALTTKSDTEAVMGQKTGFLILETEPSGAQVFLIEDDTETYIGDATVQKKLAYGTYNYRICMPMYQDEIGAVTINQKSEQIKVVLQPYISSYGILDIITMPYYANISINGKNYGITPTTLDLPPGEYDVLLSKDGYQSVQQHVSVIENIQSTIEVSLTNVAELAEIEEDTVSEYTPTIEDTIFDTIDQELSVVDSLETKAPRLALDSSIVLHPEVKKLIQNMVFVEGGTFLMGAQNSDKNKPNYDPDAEIDEAPVHKVTLSDYYICKYEVTQGLWEAIMGTTVQDKTTEKRNFGIGSDYPMYYVNYKEAFTFCTKLSELTGMKFRLPTEAEWEYAARGGNKSKNYKYSGSNNPHEVGWIKGGWYEEEEMLDHYVTGAIATLTKKYVNRNFPVGKKKPNELGIYDMSGNVWEWCSDLFGDYPPIPQINPTGHDWSNDCIFRGGGWFYDLRFCRVTYRDGNIPNTQQPDLGFRVVCEL